MKRPRRRHTGATRTKLKILFRILFVVIAAALITSLSIVLGTHLKNKAASAESVATSNECMVNTNPGATIFWKALNAGQSQMAWEWPDGAKSAKLTITGRGMTAEKIYGKADAFPVWNPPVPDDFNEDDVYTARLTFYSGLKGTGGEVSQLVANGIGFVRGVSGAAPHVTGWGASGAKPAMFGAVIVMDIWSEVLSTTRSPSNHSGFFPESAVTRH